MKKLLYTNDQATKARYVAKRNEAFGGLMFVAYALFFAGLCLFMLLLIGVL